MKNVVLENCSFIVYKEIELTKNEQKELTHLYMPLIGPNAINLYMTLISFIEGHKTETEKIGHLKLFQLLKIKQEQDFIKERIKLEAIGLLNVYQKEQDFIYEVKNPLPPSEFFKDEILSNFLLDSVSQEGFSELAMEFVIHSFDKNEYVDITKSFDEVFKVENKDVSYANELSSLINVSNKEIKVKNKNFDYQYFLILMSSLDVLDSELLNSKELYELVNRYSFLYLLSTEEIKDAAVACVSSNKTLDFESFKKYCKALYAKKGETPKITPVTTTENNNRLINYLESTSPTEVVKTKFGIGLVASEIDMFDDLLSTTGITLGMLNILIIYVLTEKNGEIPSYNYFDKIIKTWQRMGITSTMQAIDHINGRDKLVKKSTSKKNVMSVPSWYEDYIKQTNDTSHQTKIEETEDTMKELNELFKFKEK